MRSAQLKSQAGQKKLGAYPKALNDMLLPVERVLQTNWMDETLGFAG